jgi:photosystem II stability/assembly factor-like uncharacterized protein
MPTQLSKLTIFVFALLLLGAACGNDAQTPQADGGMFRTSDGGETWTQKIVYPTSQGLSSIAHVDAINLIVDPTDRKTLYAGTLAKGLLVSYNQGETWQHVNLIQSGVVREVIIDPTDRCNIYIAWINKVMRSEDCTRTWTELYSVPQQGVQIRGLAMNPEDSSILFAGLSNGHLLKTRDSGVTWRVANQFGNRIVRLSYKPGDSSIMYAALFSQGLWRSLNGGTTWESLKDKMAGAASAGTRNFSSGYDLEFDPSDSSTLYYATNVGILKSIDDGESWEIVPLLTSPGEARIYEVAISPHDPKVIYYGALLGLRPVLYKSSDSGRNWSIKKVPSTRIPISIDFDPKTDGLMYLGTYFRPPPK